MEMNWAEGISSMYYDKSWNDEDIHLQSENVLTFDLENYLAFK